MKQDECEPLRVARVPQSMRGNGLYPLTMIVIDGEYDGWYTDVVLLQNMSLSRSGSIWPLNLYLYHARNEHILTRKPIKDAPFASA